MKNLTRIIAFAIIAFSTVTAFAQKKEKRFSGTVTFNIESVGKTPVPLNMTEMSIKLLDNRGIYNNGNVIINGNTIYQVQDITQIQAYIQQAGADFDYAGPWKFYTKTEIKQSFIDSLFLDGKYTITYLDETKEIQGVTAKKAVVIIKGEDDDTKESEVWYVENMGPEYDLSFVLGLKGFPLEFTQALNEESAVKYTAKVISNKKIKDAEFLLPAGYDELSAEKFLDFQEKLQILMEEMQY